MYSHILLKYDSACQSQGKSLARSKAINAAVKKSSAKRCFIKVTTISATTLPELKSWILHVVCDQVNCGNIFTSMLGHKNTVF